MNVQLGNAVEYIDEQNKGPLGEILIRCNNILYISGIEEADEDDDAMA
jgi:small nuclear ribonucleoprotein (snRNP)-like protein